MQVAHRSHVLSMLDGKKLREIIEEERPDYIIPEVEAIATDTLVALEKEGYSVTPTATAAYLTMNREGSVGWQPSNWDCPPRPTSLHRPARIRGCRSGDWHALCGKTHYEFVGSWTERGYVLPTILTTPGIMPRRVGRAGAGRVIVEGFVKFDYEITQLTVRHSAGTTFLKPVGHIQVDGDYRESWQPQAMSPKALERAQEIARKVTDALGGYGIFGVELFVKGDDVLFSEVSPRPHDTGMVTMISQDLSQFALHARAVLGLPVPGVRFYGPSPRVPLWSKAIPTRWYSAISIRYWPRRACRCVSSVNPR